MDAVATTGDAPIVALVRHSRAVAAEMAGEVSSVVLGATEAAKTRLREQLAMAVAEAQLAEVLEDVAGLQRSLHNYYVRLAKADTLTRKLLTNAMAASGGRLISLVQLSLQCDSDEAKRIATTVVDEIRTAVRQETGVSKLPRGPLALLLTGSKDDEP